MTIRPIIFSDPMVLALFEGRKTQTRRLATSPLARCKIGDLLYVRSAFYRSDGKKHPSIHMLRRDSVLTLEVTDVRRERLQMIRNADVKAEGFSSSVEMEVLWDKLHGDGSWRKNPDVVAITFKVHRCNVDQMARVA